MNRSSRPESAIELLREAQEQTHALRSLYLLLTPEQHQKQLRFIDHRQKRALELLEHDTDDGK